MTKRRRAGVPKRVRARTTKKQPSASKPSEGGRPSRSPFHTDWKYLDVDVRTTPKAAATDGGGVGKVEKGRRSQRLAPNAVEGKRGRDRDTPSRTHTYFEPMKPWQEKTDAQVLTWLRAQDDSYQAFIDRGTATWLSRLKANAAGVETKVWLDRWLRAPDVTLPSDDALVAYLRKMSAPACRCGFDGSPRSFHSFGLACMKRDRVPLIKEEDDDDDIPF